MAQSNSMKTLKWKFRKIHKKTPVLESKRVFSYGYCEIFKNTCFEEHLRKTASRWWNCLTAWVDLSRSQSITHYMSLLSFYTPLKASKLLWFSDVFRGYRMKPVALNGLRTVECKAFPNTILNKITWHPPSPCWCF